ncbi:MAG: histidinol-phosphate transaminase [Lachnospiraceae bacterium]|nr:histidinol-phosphate transaminase [Lachnospiraceae bacterium]
MREDNFRKVIPYTPGEQPGGRVIKLNTNECPYPPSPYVVRALTEMDPDRLRLYPDPLCTRFIKALSSYYKVPENMIFAGVGSDDVLSMCFMTYFNSGREILFPDITYSFYDVWADVYRVPYKTVPLLDDFSLDVEGFKAGNGGVIIANPNAPTGRLEKTETIEEILKANNDSVVIVDEAYIDFGGESALPLIFKYDNLIVVRTLSKSRALAGMRLGYAFGNEKLIKYLNDVKFSVNSYTLNTPSILAGEAAIEDDAYFKEIRDKVIKVREETKQSLKEMGFEFCDSMTNFIFAKKQGMDAKAVFEKLKERNIYVRYFNKPRINEYLRISIGTDEEMKTFIKALKEILE